MSDFQLNTPIAFFIFNRPDTTKVVFEAIRKVKPKQLFIVADGTRINKLGEEQLCEQTRAITDNIDWDCEVKRNYSQVNLGCKKRLSSGISWIFENVEQAIFLEDDCLPDISFFRYCQELLEHYKENENVMLISGNKVLSDYTGINTSYYFSKFAHIWGWASWRRAWKYYDVNMSDWETINQIEFLKRVIPTKVGVKYWRLILDEVYSELIDTWDYQLQYMLWKKNGLSIIPAKNLVVNIGFNNVEATHTKSSGGLYSKMKFEEMNFPLIHTNDVKVNSEADRIESKLFHKFGIKEIIRRLILQIGIKV